MFCRYLPITFALLILACDLRDAPVADPAELFERGVSLFEEHSYQQAEELLQQALALFDAHNNPGEAARVLAYLGQIKLARGHYRAAREEFQAAIEKSRAANNYRTESQLNIYLGDLFSEMREFPLALQHYQAALSYYSAFNDRKASAGVEMKMAKAYRWGGEDETALQYFERALEYYTTASDVLAKAAALDGIGEIYARHGRQPEALNSYTQALAALGGTDDVVLQAKLRWHAGLSHHAQGNLNAALEQLRQAANALRSYRNAPELEAAVLFSIGSVHYRSGRFAEAKGYFAQAAAVAKNAGDTIGEHYNGIMMLRCDELQMKPAEMQRGVEQLIQGYSRLAAEMRNTGQRIGQAFALAQVGRLYAARGDVARSVDAYTKAVEIQEAVTGEYYHNEYHAPYREELSLEAERERWYNALAELHLAATSSGGGQQSFLLLERKTARRLHEQLFDVDLNLRHPQVQQQVPRTKEKLRQLRRLEVEWSRLFAVHPRTATDEQIQALQREIGMLKEEIAQAADRIANTYPNYELLVRTGDVKFAELQSLIPRGTLVLRFLPGSDRLYIFAVTRSRFEVRTSTIPQRTLLNQVQEYMKLLNDPNVYAAASGVAGLPAMTRFGTLSTQLYEYFLRPVDGLYERNLLIIPGEEFEKFPFHAIERQDRRGNVQYVVEFMSVDYLPSLATLKYRTAMSVRTKDVTAAGNPTGKNWSIDYELRDIRSFYKGATILIGSEASWQNLLKARGDVLQISSDFSRGRMSHPLGTVLLSGGAAAGGTVEIPFQKLTELSVFPVLYLSNQLGDGGGLSSAHALVLHIAGTGDVFLNMWYGERKAAKFFSEYFYTHLASGLAPGDAYRQALLNMIRTKDVNHPHAWAQFFHFGIG